MSLKITSGFDQLQTKFEFSHFIVINSFDFIMSL